MRATKTAIAAALRSDNNVTKLVPREQIYAVERATLPTAASGRAYRASQVLSASMTGRWCGTS